MLTRRFPMFGLFAVLLALAAQLGSGAALPRTPVPASVMLCHSANSDGGGGDSLPVHDPTHPATCQLCPLCLTQPTQGETLIPAATVLAPPAVLAAVARQRAVTATASPAPRRPQSQPRAPPAAS
jgi:hypothetical protein